MQRKAFLSSAQFAVMDSRRREKYLYAILLLFLLAVFTHLKLGHWENPLSYPHPMKFQRAVGPALAMAEHSDPLRFELFFKVNPVEGGLMQELPSSFWWNWGLLATIVALEAKSLEFSTHLFGNFLGIVILLLAYTYFSRAFDQRFALVAVALLSLSYHFNLLAFSTPMDTFMYIFFFLSLIFLEGYLSSGEGKKLVLAALAGGLALNAKYSIALIMLPLVAVLLLYRRRGGAFVDMGIYLPLLLVPELIYRASFQHVVTNSLHFLVTLVAAAGAYALYRRGDILLEGSGRLWGGVLGKRSYTAMAAVLALLLGFALWQALGFSRYLGKALVVEPELLFNYGLYKYMLVEQFKPEVGERFYNLGLVGLLVLPFSSLGRRKVVVLAFIAGLAVYWFFASKIIFFHMYYRAIFALVWALLGAVAIYELLSRLEGLAGRGAVSNLALPVLGVALALGLLFSQSAEIIDSNFKVYPMGEAAQYLRENTGEEELFLYQAGGYVISLNAGRKGVSISSLEDMREEILESGLGSTMERYNISYLVSRWKLRINRVPNIYSPEKDRKPMGEIRTQLILEEIGQREKSSSSYYSEWASERWVRKHFIFEKEVQNFYFYRIR